MGLLARRDLSKLALHNSEHLSDCEKDPTREFILVINSQPVVKDLSDVRLQDLRCCKGVE